MPHQAEAIDSQIADVLTFKDAFADEFEKLITTGITSEITLPSTQDPTPEFYKLYENDTRVDIANSTTYQNTPNTHQFAVPGGTSVRWQSRERGHYITSFDAVWSAALRLLTALETGDVLRVGQSTETLDPSTSTGTGWYYEFTADQPPRYVIYDDGVQASATYSDFPVPVTTPIRLASQFNLYDVGPHLPSVYHTDTTADASDPGVLTKLDGVAVDDDWAVSQFTLPIFFELDVAAGNNTKTLDAGSMGYLVLGDVSQKFRPKWTRDREISFTGSLSINSSDYTPFYAVRLKPGDETRKVNFTAFQLTADVPGEVVIKAFYPDQVAFQNGAPNWRTPPQQTPGTAIIQVSDAIVEVENQNGTLVSQTPSPGGFQVGFVTDEGSGNGNRVSEGNQQAMENPLYPDAVCVALKRNDPGTNVGSGGEFAFATAKTK